MAVSFLGERFVFEVGVRVCGVLLIRVLTLLSLGHVGHELGKLPRVGCILSWL